MARSIILACGNPLRGDDGVAPQIAHSLQAVYTEPETQIVCVHQWVPELAESLSKSELAIFIDASATIPPGQIRLESVASGDERPGATTHSLSPQRLLALAQELYRTAPKQAYLVTVGGASFEHGERLSDAVRHAIPAACKRIKALLSGDDTPSHSSF